MRQLALSLFALALFGSAVSAQNLVLNGGFETPSNPNLNPPFGAINVTNGTPGYDVASFSWTIGGVNVDHIVNTFWASNSGTASLDLNGNQLGTISQSFSTVVGETYTLSFWYTNNGQMPSQTTANGVVNVTGGAVLLNQNLSASGSVIGNMNYTQFSVNFVADSTTTTLLFTGNPATGAGYPTGSDNSQGIVLDDISVTAFAIPEPATVIMGCGIAGLLGAGAYSVRRNQLRRRQREERKAKMA